MDVSYTSYSVLAVVVAAENVNKQRASRTVHTLLAKKRSHGIAH